MRISSNNSISGEAPRLTITGRDGRTADVSRLYRSLSWSGNLRQTAREAAFELLVPGGGRDVPEVAADKGCAVALELGGERLYTGTIVKRKHDSEAPFMTVECLDRGWYLRNEGWYSFRATPEQAARTLCGDFGIPVGALASTGVVVSRKFPGVGLNKIIDTMYSQAAEQTGKRYLTRFDGLGRLCVVEKGLEPVGPVLAPRANLMRTSVAEDVSSLCTAVAIYSGTGDLIRRVEEESARTVYGLFQHVLTQKKGADAGREAAKYLADHGEQQTVTVECLGDPRLVTGAAVVLRAEHSGAAGLFWVDSDVHTWKNGQYLCKLTLNLKNVMNETSAGKEK